MTMFVYKKKNIYIYTKKTKQNEFIEKKTFLILLLYSNALYYITNRDEKNIQNFKYYRTIHQIIVFFIILNY